MHDSEDESPEHLEDELEFPESPATSPGAPGASPGVGHVPVLPEQVLGCLDPKPGQVMLDCTLGRAGHASLIIPGLSPGGRYVGFDLDPANLAFASDRLAFAKDLGVRVDLIRSNFALAPAALTEIGISKVDLLLADLGFASTQMDDPMRGFSFRNDGPLDMRLDPDGPVSAADIVNTWPEKELADLIYTYGEERLSRKIARKIVEERSRSPMKNTSGLAALVRKAYGPFAGKSRIDPATRTFMALRIAVNEELGALERLLEYIPSLMAKDGRAAIISFHSLEDRLVKRAFLGYQQSGTATRLTNKPLIASDEERQKNPRSRSAKLRAVQWSPKKERYTKDR